MARGRFASVPEVDRAVAAARDLGTALRDVDRLEVGVQGRAARDFSPVPSPSTSGRRHERGAVRSADRRLQPGAGRSLRHHAAGRPGRRGDQGRAARRR
ncbi:hypothetical protein [Nonomuraea salmonea]|uniref:hypothetical protein n=1 Tax=Nonomuraea salmonea TaxID=46181 RepID=UPI0031E649BF